MLYNPALRTSAENSENPAFCMMPVFNWLTGIFSMSVIIFLMISSLIFILTAIHKWLQSEFDFSGPEVYL